ncbi:hypothetical protein E1B28_010301 [Marasmius oreades]|uniref:Helicase SWR1 n=1 Tax=Marasmius oreades TaxID=181124 RepID=A0A9P7RXI6_9AGAR|nr:uncharacterized protein E1B28_010301 [Marasmius oreades]KAG7091252.1 hypothetical protein E1B28_010301 [Marasmius oreades]
MSRNILRMDGEAETKASGSRRLRNGRTRSSEIGEKTIAQESTPEALIAEKRAQLERVYDRHDTMVRELFHMENFRVMTTYDPAEAKRDDSSIFREFKSRYDLLEKIPNTSSGLQRRTRSTQSDRSSFFGPSISAPLPKRRKIVAADTAGIWNIITSAKIKGKEKANEDAVTEPVEASESISVSKKFSRGKRKSSTAVDSIRTTGSGVAIPSDGNTGATRKRRKGEVGPTMENNTHDPGGLAPILNPPSTFPRNHIPPPSQTLTTSPSNIKRIKLIVRKPPPLLSNPRQRPPPPKFNNSLARVVSSFSYWEEVGIDAESLDRRAREEATLLERAARLRRMGRFQLDIAELGPDINCDPHRTGYQGRQSKDVWEYLLEDVARYNRIRRKRPSGQAIANQVASKIRSYWELQATKQDKAKAQEEKRLRSLAKATIKMVTSEWRKAVFHIREQERLKLEAEEVRRGHEHLDAILNQSGQILETQQVELSRHDLSRSSSHSRSASASLLYPMESEDEDSDEEEHDSNDSEEDGSAGGGDGLQEQGDNVDIDLSALYEGFNDDQGRSSRSPAMSASGPSRHTSPIRSRSMSTTSLRSQPHELSAQEDTILLASSPIPGPMNANLNTADLKHDTRTPLSHSPSPPSDAVVTPPNDVPVIQYAKESSALYSSTSDESVTIEPFVIPDKPSMNDTSRKPPNDDVPIVDVPLKGQQSRAEEESGPKDPTVSNVRDETAQHNESEEEAEDEIPEYLKPYSVAPVRWDPSSKITQPLLLRGVLRPYQFSGLEWLASLHTNNLNGILADEMGLGKTIQTIALLAHLACNGGIWGPHLIIVPTSVILNWEMEFKKFLPGFKVLSYHGTTKRRKELRQGWSEKHHFNVCITSYTLASRDAHIFKRKPWYYMILDEAHMIKNFKSQRWNILLMFRSFRRLLLTGTPLQNNLTELWALLQFLMSGANFANLKEFGEWFSNPLEKAIEMGNVLDDETLQRVSKLHTVLRPYLLRRLKRDVEKELPSKYEHLMLCPLSKRQRYLYDEFMSRAQTQDALQSGVYQKIANILMQLRKVCNHPDLFEVRPIVTSFTMERSAITDFEIKELLVRRRLLEEEPGLNMDFLGLQFVGQQETSLMSAIETRRLDASSLFPSDPEFMSIPPPPKDTRTIVGFRAYDRWQRRVRELSYWEHLSYVNEKRCSRTPIYSSEMVTVVRRLSKPLVPLTALDLRLCYMNTVQNINGAVRSYVERAEQMASVVDRFAFITPTVVARDLPRIALSGHEDVVQEQPIGFDDVLHRAAVKLQIAFPDPLLLQFDCGKLQTLAELLREKKAGGHRVLIFTQMTRILDILETFLNFHGYLYLRLDGATKIEDRQYITERFNADARVFCFISSSRSGGVGINLTGADTVVFYDSDFNPQMDRQCEDRAHRIGQIRDVHIYRFVSQHSVEEAMLRKANQKRSLDDLVIQRGEFDWRSLFDNETAITRALGEFDDTEDARAAELAAQEAVSLEGADKVDFGVDGEGLGEAYPGEHRTQVPEHLGSSGKQDAEADVEDEPEGEDDGGTVVEYMLASVKRDYEFFQDWRV